MGAAIQANYDLSQFSQGWSLQFYVPTSDINVARQTAAHGPLIKALRDLLHPAVELGRLRLRRVWDGDGEEPARANEPVTIQKPGLAIDPDNPPPNLDIPNKMAGPPDVVMTSALIHLEAGDCAAQRKLWLRGLPDLWTLRGITSGRTKREAALGRALDQFLGFVVGRFAIRHVKGIEDEEFDWKEIDYIAPAEGGVNTAVVTFEDHNLEEGDLVSFTGWSGKMGLQGFRGVHKILGVGTNWFRIGVSYHLTAGTILGGGAGLWTTGNHISGFKTRKIEYEFLLITEASFERLRSRDTGKPYDLTRGRALGRRWRNAPPVNV